MTHYEGVQEGDLDKALSVFTDDVERTMSGAGTLQGLDAFRAVMHVYFDRLEMMNQLGVIPGRS